MGKKLTIATLNVRGITNFTKRSSVFQWVKEHKVDVACLQETYCTKSFKKKFSKCWDGKLYHSVTVTESKHSRGVCILVDKDCNCEIYNTKSDNEGRIILISALINNSKFDIISIYNPTNLNERIAFLKNLDSWIDENKSCDNLIICGDINCIADKRDRSSKHTDKSTDILNNFKTTRKVTDLWRKIHPNDISFTYINPIHQHASSRIDVILVSNHILKYATTCDHVCAPVPDHRAVIAQINTHTNKRGKGYWKLNVSILKENDYVTNVKSIIRNTVLEFNNGVNVGEIWDLIKIRVKEYSVIYCQERARNKNNRIKELEQKMTTIDQEIVKSNERNNRQEREFIKCELDGLYLDQAMGAQIRSRSKWVEESERSTAYFLNLEKRHQRNNCIVSLTDSNRTLYKDEEILEVIEKYYTELYQSNNVANEEIDEFLKPLKMRALSNADAVCCEGMISENECKIAIDSMKNNKSPGIDGLPVEFYRTFWDDLKEIMVKMYCESYESNILPYSMCMSVMSLIFKKGDTNHISNYRPISLTNIDYRILAFILSNRLQKVISNIICTTQVAYIKK